MEDITITEKWYESNQRRSKTPGPDERHRFWLKSLTNLQLRLADQMNKVLEASENKQSEKEKGNKPRNYRSITCLPTTYKLLMGINANQIYSDLKRKGLLPVEKKGCSKNLREQRTSY